MMQLTRAVGQLQQRVFNGGAAVGYRVCMGAPEVGHAPHVTDCDPDGIFAAFGVDPGRGSDGMRDLQTAMMATEVSEEQGRMFRHCATIACGRGLGVKAYEAWLADEALVRDTLQRRYDTLTNGADGAAVKAVKIWQPESALQQYPQLCGPHVYRRYVTRSFHIGLFFFCCPNRWKEEYAGILKGVDPLD